jgi:hypothetical protein
VLPAADGTGQESHARTSKGYKKLDVNYSTLQLGLALGISIKTINYADPTTRRFTKNYSRNENELRAEATDYHKRQPWAVLVAVIFLPKSSCSDASPRTEAGASSFGSAVRFFRSISGRISPSGELDVFERVFIGLYDEHGAVVFFDVDHAPPKSREPQADEVTDFDGLLEGIKAAYDARNAPPFAWADDPVEAVEPLELEEDD